MLLVTIGDGTAFDMHNLSVLGNHMIFRLNCNMYALQEHTVWNISVGINSLLGFLRTPSPSLNLMFANKPVNIPIGSANWLHAGNCKVAEWAAPQLTYSHLKQQEQCE